MNGNIKGSVTSGQLGKMASDFFQLGISSLFTKIQGYRSFPVLACRCKTNGKTEMEKNKKNAAIEKEVETERNRERIRPRHRD